MEDITAKETATDGDLATALGVLGNFVGPPKEQTGLVIQLCLLLHSLLHLEWTDRKTDIFYQYEKSTTLSTATQTI